MPDDTGLRAQARAAIRNRRLPADPPVNVWRGRGIGAECAVCRRPVAGDEMGLELEFVRDGDTTDVHVLHAHSPCFAAWESER